MRFLLYLFIFCASRRCFLTSPLARSLSLPIFFFPPSNGSPPAAGPRCRDNQPNGDCPRPGFPALRAPRLLLPLIVETGRGAEGLVPRRRTRRICRPEKQRQRLGLGGNPRPRRPLKRHGGPRRAPGHLPSPQVAGGQGRGGFPRGIQEAVAEVHRRPGGVLGRSGREGVFLVEEVGRRVYQVSWFLFLFLLRARHLQEICYCSDACAVRFGARARSEKASLFFDFDAEMASRVAAGRFG